MSTQSQIEQFALESGFDAAGIAQLKDQSEGFLRFKAWIEKKFHGEMSYLERGASKRAKPDLILEGAKSVIALAWDYSGRSKRLEVRSKKLESSKFSTSFISRYACGEDYHLILGEKLKVLEEKLRQNFPNAQFKSYVDTGPVMEKYWASLAGLGWIGKHTNLIHSERGSYFFLASLLTDLEIEPDTPASDHCGRCTACIDVCPTRAIVAPYVLDARLCISYLTIELKGPIPRHLRPLMGTHIFGCDDCQEVCPWNRFSHLPVESLREVDSSQLVEFLSLSPEEFKKRFANTPILRAKRKGFLRNVCVALGNMKDPSTIPALVLALQDLESLIRGHAAWALGQFKSEEAKGHLHERLKIEEENWVREEIVGALERVLHFDF
jgi:epoxyqueuosine reductase